VPRIRVGEVPLDRTTERTSDVDIHHAGHRVEEELERLGSELRLARVVADDPRVDQDPRSAGTLLVGLR
jgi:hypothetical protein